MDSIQPLVAGYASGLATSPRYPRQGSYVCVSTHGWVGGVIRHLTHSDVNHAFLLTDNDGNGVEATPDGVQTCHLLDYQGATAYVYPDPLAVDPDGYDDYHREFVALAGLATLHTPYNDLDIFALGLEGLSLPHKALIRLAGVDGHVVCSALCAWAAAQSHIDWRNGRPSIAAVRPSDLRNRSGVVPLRWSES